MTTASEGVRTAWLCPGHGPQDAGMLAELESLPRAASLLEGASTVAGEDLRSRLAGGDAQWLRRNEYASLLTVVFALAAGEALRERGEECHVLAGYSVGQWAAMCLAGMLDEEATLWAVWQRAALMNASRAAGGRMLAVTGLTDADVEGVCARLREDGETVSVSNFNAVGQVTVAGTALGVERARDALQALRPHQLVDVNTSGAWHCPLLEDVRDAFRARLDGIDFREPRVPVLDNVTGHPLPGRADTLRERLAMHLVSPVHWRHGIAHMLADGVQRFVEAGYGNMLSKFGMFISRDVRHLPLRKLLPASGVRV